jgi:hypothetical protein
MEPGRELLQDRSLRHLLIALVVALGASVLRHRCESILSFLVQSPKMGKGWCRGLQWRRCFHSPRCRPYAG